jgi:hypothetical protein
VVALFFIIFLASKYTCLSLHKKTEYLWATRTHPTEIAVSIPLTTSASFQVLPQAWHVLEHQTSKGKTCGHIHVLESLHSAPSKRSEKIRKFIMSIFSFLSYFKFWVKATLTYKSQSQNVICKGRLSALSLTTFTLAVKSTCQSASMPW